jgi:uncharacterized protein (TIGR03118 family)
VLFKKLKPNHKQENKMITSIRKQHWTIPSAISFCVVLVAALVFSNSTSLHAQGYAVNPLVADIPMGPANIDTNLVNAWGMALLPNDMLVVNANENNLAGLYTTDGEVTGSYIEVDSAPSGLILNKTGGFKVSDGGKARASDLIFVTEEGTILGWNSHLASPTAVVAVDDSDFGTVYKGAAMIGDRLFAADFRNGVVNVYDSKWRWLGAFTDSQVDPGFGPFNVADIDGLLYVAFAKIAPPDFTDDEAGPGNGYVDVFNANGHFLRRLVSHGPLNSPWGMAKAPANFGEFSGDLLVGNFGDGTINAFNIKTGAFLGTLSDSGGTPIGISGLWALEFGTTKAARGKNIPTLFFSAGPNGEGDGLIGNIKVNGN